MRLKGQVAIVTGSSMGIGEAIAEAFCREGAKVVINSRFLERAKKVADRLVKASYEAHPIQADVSRKAEVDHLVEATVSRLGRLDCIVNNAGTSMIGPSEQLPEEKWRLTIDLNLTGVFFCCQAAARVMIPQGGGSIINLASILGVVGLPKRAAYCASKSGLIGLTKVLGSEWAKHRIRVNVINPGYIRTAMDVHDQAVGDYTDSDIERRTPMGRYGRVEEVAAAAVFLASNESSYVTGGCIDVDGGWIAYGGW